MPKIKSDTKARVSLRLSTKIYDKLRKEAEAQDKTESELMRDIITAYIIAKRGL